MDLRYDYYVFYLFIIIINKEEKGRGWGLERDVIG